MRTIICKSCNKKLDEDLSILGECHDCSIKSMNTPQGEGAELVVKNPLTTPEAIIRGQCLNIAANKLRDCHIDIFPEILLEQAKRIYSEVHDWLRYE